MVLISKHWITSFSTAQDLLKDKTYKIENVIPDIFRKTDTSISSVLYGDPSFSAERNTNILNSSRDYILSTKMVWIYSLYRNMILNLNLPNFCFPTYWISFISSPLSWLHFLLVLCFFQVYKILLSLAIVIFTFLCVCFLYMLFI